MNKLTLAAFAIAGAAVAVPASATIIMVDASSIQGDNVLFNDGTQTGTMVQGFTQSGTAVNFMGTTTGGGNVIRAHGGQALVEGNLNAGTPQPNDTLELTTLNFQLAGTGTFNNLEFNLFGANSGETVTFRIFDNAGDIFNFSQALSNGENRFGFVGIDGQSIRRVEITTTAGIQDIRQVRLDQVAMGAIPEPATWAMFLMGFGAVGYSMRSRKAGYKVLQAV